MGAQKLIDLPESPLIVGENFPTYDETAYSREAGQQRSSAQSAADAGDVAMSAARYTDPAFRGRAGAALATTLSEHHQTLSADQARHNDVASWLDRGADNISRTKAAMNRIVIEYHDTYDDLCRRARDETWPQQRLRAEKDAAVAAAQGRVHAAREAFDVRHHAIRNAIVTADAPGIPAARTESDPIVGPRDDSPPKAGGSAGTPLPDGKFTAVPNHQFTENDLYPHDPNAGDVHQDSIGDCYLDASMGAIATANPQWIKDRIKFDPESGDFDVTLWNGHDWQHVPVSQADVSTNVAHHGASARDDGQANAAIWPSVIESAYAKYHCPDMSLGQALEINGGYGPAAMEALTGNQGTSIDPPGVWWTNEHIDQHISQALANHQPVTVSTTEQSGSLIPKHTYVVQSINGTGGDAEVTLRNPWGHNPSDDHNPFVTIKLGDMIGSGPTGGFSKWGTHPIREVNIGSLG